MGVKSDLKNLPLDQLLGYLITHERILEDNQNKKKKGTALKSTLKMEEELEDEYMVLLTRKSKQFPQQKKEISLMYYFFVALHIISWLLCIYGHLVNKVL